MAKNQLTSIVKAKKCKLYDEKFQQAIFKNQKKAKRIMDRISEAFP